MTNTISTIDRLESILIEASNVADDLYMEAKTKQQRGCAVNLSRAIEAALECMDIAKGADDER